MIIEAIAWAVITISFIVAAFVAIVGDARVSRLIKPLEDR
jgi:hypothetical protein